MRGVRAVMICLVAALALTGCMHAAGPVAMAEPQGDLDSLAYGPAPAASARYEVANSGGAVSALRNAFAASPQRAYAPAPAYAGVPEPAAYDTSYKLDAGDKLRVVVYGQEGLTNSYAIDAGG